MLRKITGLLRPFGVAFGIFITLNLALALEEPRLSVTHTWLVVPLAEPFLSVFAGVLGAVLFLPDAAARNAGARSIAGGVFLGFGILVAASAVGDYEALYTGRISSDVPVPFSLFLGLILLSECLRVYLWKPTDPLTPPPARVFLGTISAAGAFLAITLAHVVSFGHIDFRRPAGAAVILGAKVDVDGTPCLALRDRLETGLELYAAGLVPCIVVTGAVDPAGQSEPLVMRDYLVRRGVPASSVIMDESGTNTWASARGVAELRRRFGFERVLAVTQYFHCARVKLIFEREGVACFTVPTCSSRTQPDDSPRRLSRESFFVLREAVAFPFYMIYYR